MSSPTNGRKAYRRPHRKSRHGCSECRRRRIKCDEKRPCCSGCLNREASCQYPLVVPQPSRTYVEASETPSPHVGSWTMAPRPDRGSTISPRFGTPAWGPTESRELELMHHWCTRTSHGFPPHLVEHFKNEVGKEALRNDFLMNALFALTTLHLATETRNAVTARSYTAAALQYQQQATSGLREVLQNITPSTCNPIFTASALLAICAVVAPFLNTDIEEGNSVSEVIMPVMEIMKGTGSIISASDRWLLQGPLSGTIRSSVSRSPSVATEAFPVQELRRLNDMFTKDESDAAFGTERAHSKHHIFEDAIQKLEDASRKGISMLPWLLKVDARFLDELKKETSLAMALLMHWSVLLNRLDGTWWSEYAGKRFVGRLANALDGRGDAWVGIVKWCRLQVELSSFRKHDSDA